MLQSVGDRLSSNALKRQIEANQRRLQESCDSNDLDGDTDRFLEDERSVVCMANFISHFLKADVTTTFDHRSKSLTDILPLSIY